MAHLDALYTRILSRIPTDVMVDTRRLLLMMMDDDGNLNYACNWLGMTKDTAYGATHHLRSVLDVPEPDDAMSYGIKCYHKSFIDYLKDFQRSGFCSDLSDATQKLHVSCIHRILKEAPNGTFVNSSYPWAIF